MIFAGVPRTTEVQVDGRVSSVICVTMARRSGDSARRKTPSNQCVPDECIFWAEVGEGMSHQHLHSTSE